MKEVSENEDKLKAMKDANRDPHDIKKFQEVLGESQMMIPVSITSRDRALDDLKEYVASLNEEEGENVDLMSCEWMSEARKMLRSEESSAGREAMQNHDNEEVEFVVTRISGLKDGEVF